VPPAKDQNPVGSLSPGREHEPFGIGVRAGTAGRDLHYLNAVLAVNRILRLTWDFRGCQDPSAQGPRLAEPRLRSRLLGQAGAVCRLFLHPEPGTA
jgi:hypothetical protein